MSRVMAAATKSLTPLPIITQENLDRMVAKRDRLRPVEQHAERELDRQIGIAQVSLAFPEAKLLDISVLRWRYPIRALNANMFRVPVPRLALINIGDPKFFIKRMTGSSQTSSMLPNGLPLRAYGDIVKQLDRATAFGRDYTLSHTWQGIIPDAAKETIDRAENHFGYYQHGRTPRVYLLTEAPFDMWSMESEPSPRPPRYLDPLIVGHADGNLFMVGSFDPTPLEQYIAEEFTT